MVPADRETEFKFVVGQFHKDVITGLDTCIRKQLVATCSKDRTVCIWNYKDHTLELMQSYQDECLAVAFHPSGLHLVVAQQDKV